MSHENLSPLTVALGLPRAERLVRLADARQRLAACQSLPAEEADPLAEAALLKETAALLRAEGDYQAALPLLEKALVLSKRALGLEHEETVLRLAALADLYLALGWYDQAMPFARHLAKNRLDLVNEAHPEHLSLVQTVAWGEWVDGRYAVAERLLRDAVARSEALFGADHPRVAGCLITLASLLVVTADDPAESIAFHRRAFALREAALGGAHPLTALAALAVAGGLARSGERRYLDEAACLAEDAVGTLRGSLSPAHPFLGDALNTQSIVLVNRKEYEAADRCFQEADDILQGTLGPDSVGCATVAHNRGAVAFRQGDLDRALALYERAMRIHEGAAAPMPLLRAATLSEHAAACSARGEHATALRHNQRALALQEQALGRSSPRLAVTLLRIGTDLANLGEIGAAEPHVRRAIDLLESARGAYHSDLVPYLRTLAEVYRNKRQFPAAASLFRWTMTILERDAEPDAALMAEVANGIGLASHEAGDIAGAEAAYLRSVVLYERIAPPPHESVRPLRNLGVLYDATGQYDLAAGFYQQAIAAAEALPAAPPAAEMALILNNLAATHTRRRDFAAAEAPIRRAAALREQEFGLVHPLTVQSYANLAGILKELGRREESDAVEKLVAAIREAIELQKVP